MARCKSNTLNGGWCSHQCQRNATVDGYCKQHHPDAVQARYETSQVRADAKYQNSPIRRLMNSNADLKELLAEALPFVESRVLIFGTSMGKTEHMPTDKAVALKKDLAYRIKEAIK